MTSYSYFHRDKNANTRNVTENTVALCSIHIGLAYTTWIVPVLSGYSISRMLSGRGGLARVRMALLIIPAIVVKLNMAGGENFYNFSTGLFL